jgi:hypothetical protein
MTQSSSAEQLQTRCGSPDAYFESGVVGGEPLAPGEIVSGPTGAFSDVVGPGSIPEGYTPYASGEVYPSGQVQSYLAGSGGRWGSSTTRALNDSIATQLEDLGFKVTNGAGRGSEQWIRGPGGGTLGGTWVDMTASNGSTWIRVQTYTTLADGITPTASEAAAAARIRAAFPNDKLLLIPK